MDPSVGFVTTGDGVRIAHSVVGEGIPYVFARGWITHLELLWSEPHIAAFFHPLAGRFRLVRFDARGNGLSDRQVPAPSLEDLVRDLEAVVTMLGDDPIILHGSSFGGPIAIAYAAMNPSRVSRLVLDNTYAQGADLADEEARVHFRGMLVGLRSRPDAVWAALGHLTGPEPEHERTTRVERARRSVDPAMAVELYALGLETDVAHLLPSVTVPALVLHREGNRAIPFEAGRRLAALLPDARLVSVRGSAANLWDERPGEALDAISAFLGTGPLRPGSAAADAEPRPRAIMFTDVAGATELTDRLGDAAARELLGAHDRLVRRMVEAHAGRVVKGTGDGFLLTFSSVTGALRAAGDVQRALADLDPRPGRLAVRIALHAGEPIEEDDDVHGISVMVASRLLAEAGPGEVVLSGVVRDLAQGRGFRFEDRGEVKLRGLDEATRLYALLWSEGR